MAVARRIAGGTVADAGRCHRSLPVARIKTAGDQQAFCDKGKVEAAAGTEGTSSYATHHLRTQLIIPPDSKPARQGSLRRLRVVGSWELHRESACTVHSACLPPGA